MQNALEGAVFKTWQCSAKLSRKREVLSSHQALGAVTSRGSRTARSHNCKELYLPYSRSSWTMLTRSCQIVWIQNCASAGNHLPHPAVLGCLQPLAQLLKSPFALFKFLSSSVGPQALDRAIWITSLIYWPHHPQPLSDSHCVSLRGRGEICPLSQGALVNQSHFQRSKEKEEEEGEHNRLSLKVLSLDGTTWSPCPLE